MDGVVALPENAGIDTETSSAPRVVCAPKDTQIRAVERYGVNFRSSGTGRIAGIVNIVSTHDQTAICYFFGGYVNVDGELVIGILAGWVSLGFPKCIPL